MNMKLTSSTLSAAIALTLTACSGTGGGVAGIGGSGFTSSGSVTGFGSIFVNGVEFDTSSSSFDIEGLSGTQTDLALGMRVKVSGSVNADGVTGTATTVTFEDQLEGPISSATFTEDADMLNKQFTVLGVTVNINADDTTFVGTGFDYDSIASGDNIQISGFYDDAGILQATAIVKKDAFVAGTTIVEAKGKLSALASNTFTLTIGTTTTLSVDASGADISQISGGLANGQFVEVKGTIATVSGTSLSATVIKLEDDQQAEGSDIEIEGFITRYVSVSDFDVDGTPVNASSATKTPSTLLLRSGIKVEVEGTVSNGVLQAAELKLREGEVKVHAVASNVDTTTNTFLMTVSGDTIKVTVNSSTRLDDKLVSETLADAVAKLEGQFLRVRGIDDGSGNGLIATRIRIRNLHDDVILQGTIDMSNIGSSVTVLGVTVEINNNTDFQDINNNTLGAGTMGHTDFDALVTPGVTLIKIKDKDVTDDIADEVELQRP
ncbi:MAG TPA: hypothetical protein ENJ87_10725 [Gammaproteobacteria bacterium]|nr:hypothetical protein [Gammaproteobacteria bacterium]